MSTRTTSAGIPSRIDCHRYTTEDKALMSNKIIYSMHTLHDVRNVVAALIAADIPKDDISLIARSDIEMEKISDQYRDASTDFAPAAMKGALSGGTAGLIAGLVAMVVPPLGISIAGAAAIATIGALTGTWTGAMVGSSLTDPIRHRFEAEIEAGRILIVVNASDGVESTIHSIMQQAGAIHMTLEETIQEDTIQKNTIQKDTIQEDTIPVN